MSVKPNWLTRLPYEIWLSVLLRSLAVSKTSLSCLIVDFWGCIPADFSKLLRACSVRTKSRLSGLYFTGRLSTMLHCFSAEMFWPSTRQVWNLNSFSRLFQRSCFASTRALPKMTSPYFARVNATFSRLGSLRKPMPEASLLRTQDSRMKSFSRPWKLSTDATSISLYSCESSYPWRCM